MSDDLTLPQKIERLGDDSDLLHEWTHGDEAATVVLGGVATPSPRKMMHDLDERESAAAQAAIAAGVTAAGNSAAAAEHSAQIASAGADVVTAHAQSIELVAANIEAVQGASGNAADAAASAAAAAASAAAAEGATTGLAPRMDAVEAKNTQQDARLDTVEAKNTQQDTKIDAVEASMTNKANINLDNATSIPSTLLNTALNASGYIGAAFRNIQTGNSAGGTVVGSGVGSFCALYAGSSAGFVLPAGGTWFVFYFGTNGTGNVEWPNSRVCVLAGGATVPVVSFAQNGFAIRIK